MNPTNARRPHWLLAIYPVLMLAIVAGMATAQDGGSDGGSEGVKSDSEGLALFFIGRRNSEMEPCGCVKNQLGGVQYEATLYSREPAESSIRVDAGNWSLYPPMPDVSMRARYVLKAMGGLLALDAVNVGEPDLANGLVFFDSLREAHPEAVRPLVSANVYLQADSGKRAFKAYHVVEKAQAGGESTSVAITGVASDSTFRTSPLVGAADYFKQDFLVKNPAIELELLVAEMKEKADLAVVLATGTWADAVGIAEAVPAIDVLVSTSQPNDRSKLSVEVGGVKIVSVHNAKGKELGKVRLAEADAGGWILASEPTWLPVSPKQLDAVPALVELIGEYKKNTEELEVEMPRGAERKFAGARYCASCHRPQYEDWITTRHADALQTLVDKGSQFDPACLKCHVVGFREANGFYNVRQGRSVANVQCESCHGAAYEHAQKQNLIRNNSVMRFDDDERDRFLAEAEALIPPSQVLEQTCVQCHQGDNDPNFDYEAKIHHVDHSAPADSVAGGR